MNSNSRTKNIAKNAAISIICQIITIILGFLSRKALIVSLGIAYNGANSLFSSVISLLSFVELGIGNAVVYKLYQPVANNDEELIASYISFYKKIYTTLAIVVFLVGCIIVPFLPLFVSVDEGITDNIYVMYFLTLTATSCTYLFAAKKTLLIADQRQYVERIVYQISHIAQVFSQIIVLFFFKDYYLFLVLQIGFTLAGNVLTSLFANKYYPFLKKKGKTLSKNRVKNLFSDVTSTMYYKIGTSCLNYIDGLFVSYFFGLVTLGKIANYTLVLSTMAGLIAQITNALSASVGNKNVLETKEGVVKSFFDSLFLVSWISFFFFVEYVFLADSFIGFVFGDEYRLDWGVVFFMGAVHLVAEIHSNAATYRYATGVFKKGRYAPLLASVINIVLSYLLLKIIGLPGLYIATVIARVAALGIIDAYYIIGGVRGIFKYFQEVGEYTAVATIVFAFVWCISKCMNIVSIVTWFAFGFIVLIVFNSVWLVAFWKKDNCKNVIRYSVSVLRLLKKKLKR